MASVKYILIEITMSVTRLRGSRPFAGVLCLALVAGIAMRAQGEGVHRKSALGLPAADVPDVGQASLGRRLFFDRRLSANGQMACATCHVPAQGFTQTDRATPSGRDGRALRRNASSLLNVVFAVPLMHDGAAPSLEAQVLTPLLDGNEMANGSFDQLEGKLDSLPDYAQAFREVFGEGPSMASIGKALAAYQRTLISGNSAFDRWMFGGQGDAMPEEAKRGFALFKGKAGCVACHTAGATAALFTDNGMHNTGVASRALKSPDTRLAQPVRTTPTVDFAGAGDRGRNEVTQVPADLYRFRTPTLRNVAVTGPYMHDGSIATLREVVEFYNGGGVANANLDPAIKPLGLSSLEVDDLVALLNSLTGSNVSELAARAETSTGNSVSP